jgi:hypothetical protein
VDTEYRVLFYQRLSVSQSAEIGGDLYEVLSTRY